MQRRQETQRLLAGRNEANPVEFASAFNLGTGAAPVPGVSGGREAGGGLGDSYGQAIAGIGEFASKHFREAAKTRYEKKAMEGAMAYQQGKSIDEIDMDGNKWALEGYRVMEAETASTALFAAQQMEISQGLHELDPDAFRERYTGRLEQALAGHDERTQDLIKQRMMEQMPRLVDQHTREHMGYTEQKNFDALAISVAQMSIDPENSDKLLAFARGERGSEGLSDARREAAVIRGIQTAYENDNPLAYSILKQHGALDDLSMEQTMALRQSQQAFENRKRGEYNETFFEARQNLTNSIERGDFADPHDAVAAYSALLAENSITMNYADATAAYGAAQTAGQHHHRAITLEMETAKLNGDFEKVAELSATFAEAAITNRDVQNGTFYSAMGQFEAGGYDTLFGNSENSRFPVRVSQMTIGELKDFSSPSGQYGQWVASSRRDGRQGTVATPMGKFQIVGSTLRTAATEMGLPDNTVFSPEVQRDIAAHLAKKRLASSSTMPGKIRALRNEWDGFNKASESTMVAIVQELEGTASITDHDYGDFDNERWKNLVTGFEGDLELAAVAYSSDGVGSERAREWEAQGRPDNFLTSKEEAFVRKVTNESSGHRYATAQSRAAVAETVYNRVAEDNAIDLYARVEPQLRALDAQVANMDISVDAYKFQRDELYSIYELDRTIQSTDRELAALDARLKAEQGIAKLQGDEAYEQNLAGFNVVTHDMGLVAEEAIQRVLDQVPADGVSPGEHAQHQTDEIARIQREFREGVLQEGQQRGITFKDQKIEDMLTKASSDFAEHTRNAQQQAMERAEIDRAVNEGRLGRIDSGLAEQAWTEANEQAINRARRESAGLTGDAKDQAVANLHQQYMEDWTAKTGYVPKHVRDKHSAAMTGELVVDGEINPFVTDAIQSYASMKRRSGMAADQLMEPEAQAVAEAVLGLSGGNPEHMPLVIRQLWAEGLEKAFRGQPLPDFMERADVKQHVNNALQGTGMQRFAARIFGEQEGSFRDLNLPQHEMDALEGFVNSRIEHMHSLVPGLNPKYIVDMAVQQAADSVVAIPARPDASAVEEFGARVRGTARGLFTPPTSTERSVRSIVDNPFGNTFIIDPTGGNIRQDVFGMAGEQYNNSHVGKALHGFINSEEFRSSVDVEFEFGDYSMNYLGTGKMIVEVAPTRGTQVDRFGRSIVDTMFGNSLPDTFMFEVDLSEAGEWYKQRDRNKLTGN